MIFVIKTEGVLSREDLAKLHDRLEAELNSNVDNKIAVIPEYCEFSIIADVGEHPVNVKVTDE